MQNTLYIFYLLNFFAFHFQLELRLQLGSPWIPLDSLRLPQPRFALTVKTFDEKLLRATGFQASKKESERERVRESKRERESEVWNRDSPQAVASRR